MKLQEFYQNGFYFLIGLIFGALVSFGIFYQPAKVQIVYKQPFLKDTIIIDSTKTQSIIFNPSQTVPNKSLTFKNNKSDSIWKPKIEPKITSKHYASLKDSILFQELVKQGIKHPEIVLAQAKLETGFYTSNLCKKHNNLFGLRHKRGYYKFNTWQESVTAYKEYVQYKYTHGDYFQFLRKIGYASDPYYVQRVKSLL